MATDTVKSTAITDLDSVPVVRPGSWLHGGGSKEYVGTVESTAAAGTSSTYRMFRVGSWMRPVSLTYSNDAMSAGAIQIGLYTVNSGAAVATSVLAGNLSVDVAHTDQAVLKPGGDIANAEKRIYELLGLTADPGLEYDVVINVPVALGNAGTHTLKGRFSW